ncbi:unnamed protein product, partial [Symbiodinium microadriaticum]
HDGFNSTDGDREKGVDVPPVESVFASWVQAEEHSNLGVLQRALAADVTPARPTNAAPRTPPPLLGLDVFMWRLLHRLRLPILMPGLLQAALALRKKIQILEDDEDSRKACFLEPGAVAGAAEISLTNPQASDVCQQDAERGWILLPATRVQTGGTAARPNESERNDRPRMKKIQATEKNVRKGDDEELGKEDPFVTGKLAEFPSLREASSGTAAGGEPTERLAIRDIGDRSPGRRTPPLFFQGPPREPIAAQPVFLRTLFVVLSEGYRPDMIPLAMKAL